MEIEIMTGFWIDIQPHLERGAVFLVDPELDLKEVAQKVAADEVQTIASWLQLGQLARPTPVQVEAWNNQGAKPFAFAILQPYVLVQELSH